jgi:proline iminopeptidase
MKARKWLRIVASVVAATAATLMLAALWLWHVMAQPLYKPGAVRQGVNLRGPLEPPSQSGKEGFWQVEKDIEIYHFSHGAGEPVLVVHGGPGYPLNASPPALDLLATDYQFHFYHQRGCGSSTRPFDRFPHSNFYANMMELERTLGIGAQVADIERIRRLLKQDKIILLGHSFGSLLAAMYAAEFPERVQAMILVAPADVLALPAEGRNLFDEIRARLPESEMAEYDAFIASYLDFGRLFENSEMELAAANRKIGEYFLRATGESDLDQSASVPMNNGGWMAQAMYLSMGKRHDYRSALSRITAPVLVVHGEDDIQSESASRAYVESLPNATMHVLRAGRTRGIRGAGHFVFTDQPESFAEAAGDFLKSVK